MHGQTAPSHSLQAPPASQFTTPRFNATQPHNQHAQFQEYSQGHGWGNSQTVPPFGMTYQHQAMQPDMQAAIDETDSLMLNEMNSSLTDCGPYEQKKTKHELNQNAVKFHLTKLQSKTIRYEVIYKNLVRDIRKFFVADFNAMICINDKP